MGVPGDGCRPALDGLADGAEQVVERLVDARDGRRTGECERAAHSAPPCVAGFLFIIFFRICQVFYS